MIARGCEALGIRRLSGRDFSATDVGGAPRVAIVNATLAHRLFPGESALGRELRLFPPSTMRWIPREPVTIVGIVDNVKEVGINEVAMSDIYLPVMQSPNPSLQLVARTGLPTESVARAVREAIAAIDPTLPVASVRTRRHTGSNTLATGSLSVSPNSCTCGSISTTTTSCPASANQ